MKTDSFKKCVSTLLALLFLLSLPAFPLTAVFADEGEPTQNEPQELDWDEITEILFTVLYTGEPADVSSLRIPFTQENKSKIYLAQALDPRFNITYATYTEYVWIDGAKYFSRFTPTPETSRSFRERYEACMDAVRTLTRGVAGNDTLSDADKCLILHDRLCVWSAYDYGNEGPAHNTAYGPLVMHLGVCQGIANAYNWLLRYVGIRAEYTNSLTLGHGWSMVYVDGEPYYVDPTWDDPGWAIPGYLHHDNFLLSYETFSEKHRRATDFSDAPSSTIYENSFPLQTTTEIVYAGGDLYYLDTSKYSSSRLIRRDAAGNETTVLSYPLSYTYTNAEGVETRKAHSILITAIGDRIIYILPFEVRAYDTVTGEDTLLFTPSAEIFSEPDYHLTGLEQRNGTIYVYANNTWHNNSLQPDYHTFMDAHCDFFQFCEHSNLTLIEQLPGENCLQVGDGKYLCEDCGEIVCTPGEGVPGAHDFSAETVSPQALYSASTCTTPRQYYYSCADCGLIEYNDAHLFAYGATEPHIFIVSGWPATESCPGYNENVCMICGAVEYSDFTFAGGAAAYGTLAEGFGWQIVNGTLSVIGSGSLPDFAADSRPPWYQYRSAVTAAAVYGGVTSIGAYAFSDLDAMTEISLPDSVTSFGAYAFANTGLTSISLPEALETIDDNCFRNAGSLGSVENNAHLASIGAYAFANCASLIDVVIPGSVSRIGSGAFNGCTGLTTLTFEAGVLQSMPEITNAACRNLRDVSIPYTLESVPNGLMCRAFIVAPENEAFTAVDGVLFSKDLKTLMIYPALRESAYYHVPATTQTIGTKAFNNVAKLRFLDMRDAGVTMPYSIWIRSQKSDLHINLPEALSCIDDMTLSFTNAPQLYVPSSVDVASRTNNRIYVSLYTDSEDAPVKAFSDLRGLSCTVLEGHTHVYDTRYYTQAPVGAIPGYAIDVCECGQFRYTELEADHTPGAPVETVVRAATCSVKGEKSVVVKCVDCGETLSETTAPIDFDPTNHADYGTATENAVLATCHSNGYTGDTVCARCRAVLTPGSVISKDTVAHAWDTGEITLSPTCKTAGTVLYRCTATGCTATWEETVGIDPDAHVFSVSVTEPTCTEGGFTTHTCTLCPYSYTDAETPAPGHAYAIRVTPATCTSGGITTYTCTRCRDSYTKDPTPALGHVDNNGDGYCDRGCGTYMGTQAPGTTQSNCVCGQYHTGQLAGIIIFFHRIVYFFKNLFS